MEPGLLELADIVAQAREAQDDDGGYRRALERLRPGGAAVGAPEFDLRAAVLALFARRDQALEAYRAAQRARRSVRDRLERRARKLEVRHRDQLSTIIDLRAVLESARDDDRPGDAGIGLTGDAPALARVRLEILHAARLDLPVLIEGETGTGKELAARAIHRLGPRALRPLVVCDCAALEAERVEAELFGWEAGAFAGAGAAQAGALVRADRGTLLLDEVGERPPEFQAKLLRACEGKSVRPLGGEARAVDGRLIATTRIEVDAALAAGRFDRGLFYRLAVARVRLPPLRAHPEDLPLLVQEQLAREGVSLRIAPEVLERLRAWPWPGNVRELQGLVARWVLLGEDRIELDHLPPTMQAMAGAAGAAWRPLPLRDWEARVVRRALAQAHGDKTQAARLLGISRAKLYAKLEAPDGAHDP